MTTKQQRKEKRQRRLDLTHTLHILEQKDCKPCGKRIGKSNDNQANTVCKG